MKKALLIVLAVLFLLSSCATERVYSFPSKDGLRVFLRPVELKGEYPLSLDISIPSEKSRLSGDAVLNYTVDGKKDYMKAVDSVSLSFFADDERIEPVSVELMFAEGSGKDKISVRFTSVIGKEDMEKIMKGISGASLSVDGIEYPLDASAFNKSLSDLSSFYILQ